MTRTLKNCILLPLLLIPAILPAAQTTEPTSQPTTTSRVSASPQQIRLPGGGDYWLSCPNNYGSKDLAPLIICLHGTDDLAKDALSFWMSRGFQLPAVWAAPQSGGRGWSDTDLPRLREMWADLQKRVSFDRERVLLAGFSAGGAMTFHWLYAESFPATAAVTLANYLPPHITGEMIARQNNIPVFYGVGMVDINHERMLAGLSLLRSQKVRVTVYRPYIGHTLSPEVGEQAVAWLDQQCHDIVKRKLDKATTALADTRRGYSAAVFEQLIAQKRWHDPDNIQVAEAGLSEARRWGLDKFRQVDTLLSSGRRFDAIALLREIEGEYDGSALAATARDRRDTLEHESNSQSLQLPVLRKGD